MTARRVRKGPQELTAAGVRGRLERFGLVLAEREGEGAAVTFTVAKQDIIGRFTTVEELRAFLCGIEAFDTVRPAPLTVAADWPPAKPKPPA